MEVFTVESFVGSLPQPIRNGENLNLVEQLCRQPIKKKHGISQSYKVLTQMEGLGILPFTEIWENKLGSHLKEQKNQ